MVLLAAVAFVIAVSSGGLVRDIAIDSAFMFTGVLVTVLYVDWALNKHEAERWEPFQGTADEHIRRAAAQFAHRVAEAFETNGPGPFQVPAWKGKNEIALWHLELVRNDEWFEYVRKSAVRNAARIRGGSCPDRTFDVLIEALRNFW